MSYSDLRAVYRISINRGKIAINGCSRNPYAPGAGTPPPELAGRDDLIDRAAVALDRIGKGRLARSFILYGLRRVGKTVLLNRIRLDAEDRGLIGTKIEAPENRSLPALLAPALRTTLLRLDRGEAMKVKAGRAMRALAGFAKALKLKYQDLELGLDIDPQKGLADSGDLDSDLTALLTAVGAAAAEQKTAVILFVDELQYVPEAQLASLISALHATSQDSLPITMVAAGLPQLVGQTGRAKPYAERLFEFVRVDRLDETAARDALTVPACEEGVAFTDEAIAEIMRQTLGFPYFLQEWGKHSWNVAS